MFVSDCRVWPVMSVVAHSPDLAPGKIGACAEMNTKPFATTQ